MEKRVSMVWGKEKDKGRKYLFFRPFTFLFTFGGECVKEKEIIIILKSDK
jgi:hypothetical protein